VSQQLASLGRASQVGVVIVASISLIILVNVAQQILFANPNEPPVVFHLFPFFGSTVEYGMDPPSFFKKMRAKVRPPESGHTPVRNWSNLTGSSF